MEALKKQVLQLTGKYDKLVHEVKTLKTKIKNDESTINTLQNEVNQLKKQKVIEPQQMHSPSAGTSLTIQTNIRNETSNETTKRVNTNNPIDLLFTDDTAVSNAGNDKLQSKGAEFGSWTTF
eukprot:695749_1